MLLSLGLKGRASGTVHVVGTPSYDQATDTVSIKDLAFDVNTEAYLGKAAGWLINGPLLNLVREHAQIPGAVLMQEVLELANKNINRELSKGIFLRGTLSSAEPLAVQAMREGLMAHAKASGRLWLEISKEDLIPASLLTSAGVPSLQERQMRRRRRLPATSQEPEEGRSLRRQHRRSSQHMMTSTTKPRREGLDGASKERLATAYSPTTSRVAVPSALQGLTTVFGMGTGVAPAR